MVVQMRRCNSAMLAKLRASPDLVTDFVMPEEFEDIAEGQLIDLDKAWHAIHFLLSGSADEAHMPEGALLAGQGIGEDVGYGPARILLPAEVLAFAGYLGSKPDDFVERHLDFAKLHAADIYPSFWDRKDPHLIKYVADNFRALKAFVGNAAAAGDAIVQILM